MGERTKKAVSDVFDVLKETQKEITEFVSHWPYGESQFSKDVGPRIREVQNNINSIQSSAPDEEGCPVWRAKARRSGPKAALRADAGPSCELMEGVIDTSARNQARESDHCCEGKSNSFL